MAIAREWQFDGLVGPTHNYAGLAFGNLAAQQNAGAVSNPRAAALQGLEKMHFVHSLGVPQAFLPPQFRPLMGTLKQLGFAGKPADLLQQVFDYSPALLASVYSSSFMWTANAATITPSCDSGDGKLHITPANMTSHFHRSIEAAHSQRMLSRIFHDTAHFTVHPPLFPNAILGDEGAANHMVACDQHGESGLHMFVYGEQEGVGLRPTRYPARQRRMASEAIARRHGITPEQCLYLQQAPEVIDAGVFHNDVIAMNTTRRMIVHAEAFTPADQQRLRDVAAQREGLVYHEVTAEELPVAEAVSTYFFNSQVLDLGENRFAILAPQESEASELARDAMLRLEAEGVVSAVHFRNLRESMRNGGGPACLRLRVVLTPEEAAALHPGVILTEAKYTALKQWVETHYRDRLSQDDFRDPSFVAELEAAYLALESICELPGLYSDSLAVSA